MWISSNRLPDFSVWKSMSSSWWPAVNISWQWDGQQTTCPGKGRLKMPNKVHCLAQDFPERSRFLEMAQLSRKKITTSIVAIELNMRGGVVLPNENCVERVHHWVYYCPVLCCCSCPIMYVVRLILVLLETCLVLEIFWFKHHYFRYLSVKCFTLSKNGMLSTEHRESRISCFKLFDPKNVRM